MTEPTSLNEFTRVAPSRLAARLNFQFALSNIRENRYAPPHVGSLLKNGHLVEKVMLLAEAKGGDAVDVRSRKRDGSDGGKNVHYGVRVTGARRSNAS
jgi:hypothetical protein